MVNHIQKSFNVDPHDFVMEFHTTYGMPVGGGINGVGFLSPERSKLRFDLIDEEYAELIQAYVANDLEEVADALGDLVYVIYGMAIEMGINLGAVLEEIQESNMSKLGEDGLPIYREDGKVLKGPNFHKPNITRALYGA